MPRPCESRAIDYSLVFGDWGSLGKAGQNSPNHVIPLTYFIWSQQKNKVDEVLGQNLGQIMSNVMKEVNKLALSIGFFHILHGEYILKQEVLVAKTPKWKSKANIARNVTFEEC